MRTTRRLPLIRQGFALLLVGVLITACGEAVEPIADTSDNVADEVPIDDDTDAETEDSAADGPIEETGPPDADEATSDESEVAIGSGVIEVTIDGRELTVADSNGEVVFTETLAKDADDAFQNVFHTLAIRPGATATELDAIVATTRGEVAILHHLRVRGGTEVTLEAIPKHLQPQDVMESSIVLGWTPDADSVLWTEPTSDQPVLRTFGWDDGPGTGRQADDNAAFALDLPMDVFVDGFTIGDDGSWTLMLTDGVGTTHELPMERQADGALALPA